MKRELVHGLTETVELKDWDFAIIQAALKLYINANAPGDRNDNKKNRLTLRKKQPKTSKT